MKKLILASNNLGKIHELTLMFAQHGITLIPQSELGIKSIPETGSTFIENALIKTRHVAQQTKYPVIGDDSGLIVPALGGKPGLHTATYAGENATAQQHIEKLLAEMANIPDEKRNAIFYSVLVCLKSAEDPLPLIAEGFCEGKILHTPVGNQGFGYDPIFYLPAYDRSCAQLSDAEKNKISHRGLAFQRLLQLINNFSFFNF